VRLHLHRRILAQKGEANKDLLSWLTDRNMGFSTPISKSGNILWMQIWLLVLALEPALTAVADGFVSIQGREETVSDVIVVYEDMSAQLKSLSHVIVLVDNKTTTVGAIVLHPDYIKRGALVDLLQQYLTGLEIYEDLEAVGTADATGTGDRLGAAVRSAGHFILGLIIKSKSCGGSGRTRVCMRQCQTQDHWPLRALDPIRDAELALRAPAPCPGRARCGRRRSVARRSVQPVPADIAGALPGVHALRLADGV
jgi:hypothetical protein